jgi:hypothetical protein
VDIDRFLASHDGVVSRDQARACGLTDDAIAWRLATGRWVRRAPRTFLDIAWAWTVAARVRTAAAWAGEQGTLIAITAAWWLGLGVVDPRPVTVALPPGCSRTPPAGGPAPRRHHRVAGQPRGGPHRRAPRAVLDIAFEDVRLAVEVDGWAHHEDVDRFVDGRARKRALVADGWVVVEVTWHDLVEAPDRLVDELRRTLVRLAART